MSRKSFNLSLQKKRNQIVLTPIIERCEKDGSPIADKVVDYVEKALQYERSVGLSKVQNTYELIKNTLPSQNQKDSPEFEKQVEEVLRTVISIDGERLSQFISDPNRYSGDASDMSASESRSPVQPSQSKQYATPLPVHEEVNEQSMGNAEISATDVSDTVDASAVTKEEDESLEFERQAQERRNQREAEKKERAILREEALRKSKEDTQAETDDDDEIDISGINVSVLNNL
jgi:hypothetical protein